MNNTMYGHQSYQTMSDPPEHAYAEKLFEFIHDKAHGLRARMGKREWGDLRDTIFAVIEAYEQKLYSED